MLRWAKRGASQAEATCEAIRGPETAGGGGGMSPGARSVCAARSCAAVKRGAAASTVTYAIG